MKIYDKEFISELIARAEAAPRRRAHHTIHNSNDDPIQRLFVALAEGTYFQPHRHPDKEELVVMLRGKMGMLVFDAAGRVTERYELSPGDTFALEHPRGNWHACVALEPGTLFIEVKSGPFKPTPVEDFAAWAPAEGQNGAAEFEQWYHTAAVGEQAPAIFSV